MKYYHVTDNFTLDEFFEHPASSDIFNIDYKYIERFHKIASFYLQPLRDEIGMPIRITSGFRSVCGNLSCGGVNNSLHLCGLAVDITCSRLNTLYDKLSALRSSDYRRDFRIKELIYHPEKHYIHVGFIDDAIPI